MIRLARSFLPVMVAISLTGIADHSVKHPIIIRLVLSHTRVLQGHPIKSVALLTNTTSKTVTVQTCEIGGWLEVGLTNKEIPFSPTAPGVRCKRIIRLTPGRNRFRLNVITHYEACVYDIGHDLPPPECLGSDSSIPTPLLPPGHYVTKVFFVGLPPGTQKPPPIPVTVLPPRD